MTAAERLLEAGYDNVLILTDYSYDDALIGVTDDDRAVYDYEKMLDWLCREEGFYYNEAIEWVEYNTIRALPYMGESAPIVIHRI